MAYAVNQSCEVGALTKWHATSTNRGGYTIAKTLPGGVTLSSSSITSLSAGNAAHWDIISATGFLYPSSAGDTDNLNSGTYVINVTLNYSDATSDNIAVTVTTTGTNADGYNLANTYHVETGVQLVYVLGLTAAEKSGKNILIRGGTVNYSGGSFNGVLNAKFNDLTATLTIGAADTSNPPLLDQMVVWSQSNPAVSAPGNVTFKDVTFSAPYTRLTSSSGLFAIDANQSATSATRKPVNVAFDNVTFTVTGMSPGRLWASENDPVLGPPAFVICTAVNGLTFTNCTFHEGMCGISVRGQSVTIDNNEFYNLWVDAIDIDHIDASGTDSSDFIIRNNHFHDQVGNNGYHPDFIQFGFSSTGYATSNPHDFLIEGNVFYYGTEGALTPASPSTYVRQALVSTSFSCVPAASGSSPLYRVNATGSAVVAALPSLASVTTGHRCAVQLWGGTAGLSVTRDRSHVIYDADTGTDMGAAKVFGRSAETWTFTKVVTPSTRWDCRMDSGGCQGIFHSGSGAPQSFTNLTIRFNILYTTSYHGISFSNTKIPGANVYNNSVMQPFTGDANGDGVLNSRADNFNTYSTGQVIVTNSNNWICRANICGDVQQNGGATGMTNEANVEGDYRSDFPAFAARFSPDSASVAVAHPTTKAEAIRIARPNTSRTIPHGVGALGTDAADDIWDWDTGTYKVNTPWYVLDLATIVATADGYTIASWKAPSADGGSAVTGYKVQESVNGVTWTNAPGYDGVTKSYTRTGGIGNGVFVRVIAVNANGDSTFYKTQTVGIPGDNPYRVSFFFGMF